MSEAKGVVVPEDGGRLLSMAPGRSSLLKLLNDETADSVMLFVETAPSGTETTFHLHKDSDEVAYVLEGEITFKVGDAVSKGGPGTCCFMPRGVPHAWKTTSAEAGRILFFYTPGGAGRFFEEQVEKPLAGPANGPEAVALRERHGWEVVGPPPF